MNAYISLLSGFLSASPHVCCLCERELYLGGDGLCDACRAALRCANAPAPAAELEGMTAGLMYDEALAHAFYRFKAHGETYLADFFAQYMQLGEDWQADAIVPVPLHPLKLWARTYNQSELLADRLAKRCGLPVSPELLRRTVYTGAQKRRTAAARRTALKSVFSAAAEVKGKSIVLVDDVVTTGSTLTACAIALKKAGAARVYGVCAAAVDR